MPTISGGEIGNHQQGTKPSFKHWQTKVNHSILNKLVQKLYDIKHKTCEYICI